jgi:hypothetical protein
MSQNSYILQPVESAGALLVLLPQWLPLSEFTSFSSVLDQGTVSAVYDHCAELFLGRKIYVGLAFVGN